MDCRGMAIAPRMIREHIGSRMNKAFMDEGITASMGQFILEIGGNPGISLKGLSSNLSVDKSLATRTVRMLMDRGVAVDSGPGRRFSLHLTDYGEDVSCRMRFELESILRDLFSDVTEEEMVIFRRVVDKIRGRISGEEQQ